MTIVYCIGSLHLPGGAERVLVNIVNFLADPFNFEVYILNADQAPLPEVIMPQWIALFKELQHE
ncbi:MAG: hypothetical protein ACQEWG_07205 [Bacteroidota bacterium]